MRESIEQSLRKSILDHRLDSAEQRRQLYDAFAKRLAQAAEKSDGSCDELKFRHWSTNFEAARAAIEADLIPLPDGPATSEERPARFGRLVDRVRRHWPMLTSVATGLTTIAEFLKPLGEFTGLLLGFGLAAASAGVVARRIRAVRDFGDAAVAGGIFVSLAAATMLAVRVFVPEAEARTDGALVAVPGLQQLQSSLLHVGTRVDEIAADSRRTADTTERVAADADRIARSVEVAKREISEDPAKELANLGISPMGWPAAWIQSVRRNDERILGLLDKAGFKPDRATLRSMGAKENAAMLAQADVRAILRTMPDRVRDAFCTPQFTVDTADPFEPNRDVEATFGFVRGIGVDEYGFYCGDFTKLITALKALQRETWVTQCRQSVETIARQTIPSFRCDFDRRTGKGAAFAAAVRPEFGREIDYLTSLSR